MYPYNPRPFGSASSPYGPPEDSWSTLLAQLANYRASDPAAAYRLPPPAPLPPPIYAGGNQQQQSGMPSLNQFNQARSVYDKFRGSPGSQRGVSYGTEQYGPSMGDLYGPGNELAGFPTYDASTGAGMGGDIYGSGLGSEWASGVGGPGVFDSGIGYGGLAGSTGGGMFGSAGSGLGMGAAEFGGGFGTGGAGFGIGEAAAPAAGGASKGAGGAAGAGAGMSAAGFGSLIAIPLIAWLDQTNQDKQADALNAHYRTPGGQAELANMVKLQSDHDASMKIALEAQNMRNYGTPTAPEPNYNW